MKALKDFQVFKVAAQTFVYFPNLGENGLAFTYEDGDDVVDVVLGAELTMSNHIQRAFAVKNGTLVPNFGKGKWTKWQRNLLKGDGLTVKAVEKAAEIAQQHLPLSQTANYQYIGY